MKTINNIPHFDPGQQDDWMVFMEPKPIDALRGANKLIKQWSDGRQCRDCKLAVWDNMLPRNKVECHRTSMVEDEDFSCAGFKER